MGVVLLGGLLGTACGAQSPDPEAPGAEVSAAAAALPQGASAPEEPACAACHPDQTASWARTGMARALGPIEPGELEGLAPVTEEASGFRYRFEQGSAGPRMVETRADTPGHRLEAELLYAIGAGELDRAFVARLGELEFFAPLEVLSGPGGRHAALAPGHQAVPGQRFSVPITPECLGCHTDRLPPQGFPLNERRVPTWEPRGIGCGACHGDVEAHARWRREHPEEAPGEGEDPVLRVGRLDRVGRMSICSACHLQGDVRISLEGRLTPPPPGGDLLAELAVFVARDAGDDVGFVSQTERLVRSRCYLEDARLACDTCHDPHRSSGDPAERARVRAACQGCHAGPLELPDASAARCSRTPADTDAARDCVDCHMRRTPTFDVAEVAIHDHFIRRRPGPPSPPVRPRPLESPEADWVRFTWPDGAPPGHLDDPGLWMMAFAARGRTARAAELLDAAPGPRTDRLASYHEARARLLEDGARFPEALAAYERALRLDPGATSAAINLGLLQGLTGDRERGIGLLSQVIAYHPRAVTALRNRAGLRFELGDTRGFEADLRAAFEAHPQAELARILADWYAQEGDSASAGSWTSRARALDPRDG